MAADDRDAVRRDLAGEWTSRAKRGGLQVAAKGDKEVRAGCIRHPRPPVSFRRAVRAAVGHAQRNR
jgi:hypothetical protein